MGAFTPLMGLPGPRAAALTGEKLSPPRLPNPLLPESKRSKPPEFPERVVHLIIKPRQSARIPETVSAGTKHATRQGNGVSAASYAGAQSGNTLLHGDSGRGRDKNTSSGRGLGGQVIYQTLASRDREDRESEGSTSSLPPIYPILLPAVSLSLLHPVSFFCPLCPLKK